MESLVATFIFAVAGLQDDKCSFFLQTAKNTNKNKKRRKAHRNRQTKENNGKYNSLKLADKAQMQTQLDLRKKY